MTLDRPVVTFFVVFSVILALLFLLVSTYTAHWIESYDEYSNTLTGSLGFLMSCKFETCRHDADFLLGPARVKASFSLMVLSNFAYLISFLSIAIAFRQQKNCLCGAGISAILGSVFALTGVALYTSSSEEDIRYSSVFFYGYSFALAWCAVGLGLIGGILSLCEEHYRIPSEMAPGI